MLESGTAMSKNPSILSYHESLLRLSDIELLQGPRWLNDTLISFYFEFLENERFDCNPVLLFVPPQVTQCIKITPSSDMGIFLDPLESKRRSFILFALNDNENTEHSGGSHWSLLVFSYPERMVYHYDSSKGMNQIQAMEFGKKLMRYFNLPSFGCFVEPECLQQSNGYDCGVHVLCNAEHLAAFALRHHKIEGCSPVDREKVITKRTEMLNIINALRYR